MSRQAYLVGCLDVSVSPPVLLGTCIFSSDAGDVCFSTSKRFVFDIATSYGEDYGAAVENLKREVAQPNRSGWALDYLVESEEIKEIERRRSFGSTTFCACGMVIGQWGAAGELWSASQHLVDKNPTAATFSEALRKCHRPERGGGCI